MSLSAHVDTFCHDNLPDVLDQPQFVFDLPSLKFGTHLNAATELLDRHVNEGRGDRLCVLAPGIRWSYRDLLSQANRIANVLVQDFGVVPGNRVLLRSSNNPMLVAAWFAVIKAGAVAVGTMPLLRARELNKLCDQAQISHALCDSALAEEVHQMLPYRLKHIGFFNSDTPDGLEALMARHSDQFSNVNTATDDVCLLGFTSGTTGVPKATAHYHRDVMASCRCWPEHVLKAHADDIFIGSPPLAFTFGLGGLVLFPFDIGAAVVLLEKAGPAQLVEGIERFGATVLFTAPTSYRAMLPEAARIKASSLRKCVSAGEALPAATRQQWREATGINIIDGIGSTEMLHIFISSDEEHARDGATGQVVPGYRAEVVDHNHHKVAAGEVGRLRVQGPTGCRYLADERQKSYVYGGWNYTGDAYWCDADGYFYYHSRIDDMIISAGYNIAGPEVEQALLQHPAVAECAVVGASDLERGQIVKAWVVLREGYARDQGTIEELQNFVKATIAPYKYPRAIVFTSELPKTATGKIQRFLLK